MKKKRNNLLRCLMLTVCLVAVFTVNVFAEGWRTINNAYFDSFLYVSEDSDTKFTYRLAGQNTDGNYAFDLNGTNPSDVVALCRAGSTFRLSISAGDKVTIHPDGDFSGWFGGTQNSINRFAWALIQFDSATNNNLPYKVLYRSNWYAVETFDPNENGTFYRVKQRDVTFTAGQSFNDVFVALLFDVDLVTGNTFSINRVTYDISWGDPNSPQAPNYAAPDSSTIDDFASLESDVIQGNAEGMSEVSNVFGSFGSNLSSIMIGVNGANILFDIAWSEFDFITPLIYIALGIGFFSVILGVLPSAISRIGSSERKSYARSGSSGRKSYRKKG